MMVALSPRLVAERFRLVVAGRRKDNLDYTVRFSYAYPVYVWGTPSGLRGVPRSCQCPAATKVSQLGGP